MRSLLLYVILLLISLELHAFDLFTIKGNVLTEQKYVLRTKDNQYSIKPNKDGAFEVEVKYEEFPFYYTVHSVSKKGKYSKISPVFWIENDSDNLTLKIRKDELNLSYKSELQKLSEKIENTKRKERIEIIQVYLDKIPGLYFLDQEKENISEEELEKILQQIPSESQSHRYVKRTTAYYEAIKREKLKKGSPIEPFRLLDESGKSQEILSNENKTKLIAVLSSGCGYSLASISLLEQINKKTDKIEIITIWSDEISNPWEIDENKQKEKITWTNLWDENRFAFEYLRVKVWPSFYIVSQEGILLDKFHGYSKRTAKKFGKLLKEK